MKDKIFKVGEVVVYPHDYGFGFFCDIPKEVALLWVKTVFPDAKMDALGHTPAKEMTLENMDRNWLNKLLIVVPSNYDWIVGLYNHDGSYSLRIKSRG